MVAHRLAYDPLGPDDLMLPDDHQDVINHVAGMERMKPKPSGFKDCRVIAKSLSSVGSIVVVDNRNDVPSKQ